MDEFYIEIEQYIKKNEVNKKARRVEENQDILTTYWNIGRLIVEAQGGEHRAKYGNELIKMWSRRFTEKYGNGYSYTNMSRYRQFYLLFPILAAVPQLSWNHIQEVIPIKDTNKRNYYINLCIKQNLSTRELRNLKKNNAYERLLDKPKKIDVILQTPKYSLKCGMHNPILLELKNQEKIETEHDLEILLLAKLKNFFSQLGEGFALIGNQYKIVYEGEKYFVDILLFNIEMNCYVVVELKVRELRKEDKGQIEFYMKIIDDTLKKPMHNKTIGILITKEQDKYIASFVESESVISLTYEVL